MNNLKLSQTRFITQTAFMIALTVIFQVATIGFGQLVTGSLVNLILIVTVALTGEISGLVVALLSPIFAFFLGIGPQFPQLIICIMLGNAVLVTTWFFLLKNQSTYRFSRLIFSAVSGAILKFSVLWLLVVKLVLPFFLVAKIPTQSVQTLTQMFSLPQLITALIGGVVGSIVVPQLNRIYRRSIQTN